MPEEPREHEDSNSNIVELHNNGFYAAVMDKYLGCVQDVSKKWEHLFQPGKKNILHLEMFCGR